jgi:prevent-host-death family protein
MKTIQASEFKAKCLALLDNVAATGEPITVLKRGKPVAEVIPFSPRRPRYPQDALAGTGEILGDIISPTTEPEDWDAER